MVSNHGYKQQKLADSSKRATLKPNLQLS